MPTHGQLPGEFHIESSIPVIRMLDEARARAFYVEFLGFSIDWEHRSGEGSPLYMQLRHGDSLLHLNGHAEEDAPVSEVRIPVRGVENYCEYLRGKTAEGSEPRLVDPRGEGEGTDMNIVSDEITTDEELCSEQLYQMLVHKSEISALAIIRNLNMHSKP